MISGFAVVSVGSALPTVAVASSDGFLPSTVAFAFTTSFSANSLPSGSFAVQFPSPSAVVSTFVLSGSSTSTFAFGSALPLISLSPVFGAVISGFAVVSVSGVVASFQTAYTVVGSVNFVTSITSASLASAVFAQPTNSFPSNFGSAGLFNPSFISSVFVVELSSNLPPFASNVTSFSSDQIAYTTW